VIFIIGRFLYSAEYVKDPKTRVLGMILTILPNVVLIVGALFGLLQGML
jgi:glutathione S-transferase